MLERENPLEILDTESEGVKAEEPRCKREGEEEAFARSGSEKVMAGA